MNINNRRMICVVTLLTAFFIVGCNRRSRVGGRSTELTPATDLGVTIGSLVDVSWPESVRLEGYGLVVGLRGTGSSECPPQVRAYFSRHIPTLLPIQHLQKAGPLIDLVLIRYGLLYRLPITTLSSYYHC